MGLNKTSIRLLPKTQRGKVKECWSCSKEKELHYRDYSVGGDICLDCFNDAHDVEQVLVNNKYLLDKENGYRHPTPNEFTGTDNH
jgi:hypothetical protein